MNIEHEIHNHVPQHNVSKKDDRRRIKMTAEGNLHQ